MDVEPKAVQFVWPGSRLSDDDDIDFINDNNQSEISDKNCMA